MRSTAGVQLGRVQFRILPLYRAQDHMHPVKVILQISHVDLPSSRHKGTLLSPCKPRQLSSLPPQGHRGQLTLYNLLPPPAPPPTLSQGHLLCCSLPQCFPCCPWSSPALVALPVGKHCPLHSCPVLPFFFLHCLFPSSVYLMITWSMPCVVTHTSGSLCLN